MPEFLVITECVISHQDKYLMIQRPSHGHASGLLSFVGGKVEIDDYQNNQDMAKQAVKREVLEEVGIDLIDPVSYLTTAFFQDSKTKANILNILFYCDIKHSNLTIKASSLEVAGWWWMSHSEIIEQPNCPPWVFQYFEILHQVINH